MSTVRTGPVIGLLVQIVLLAVLAETVGLGAAGWVAGLAYGVVLCALLSRGMSRSGAGALSPADRVTLSRAILVGGVTALAADSFGRSAPVTLMVVLTSVALALDAVDGYTARRTGTTSELGARFDMEIDSFLVLVLCLHVAPSVGGWVLAIGAMRYVFVAATWVLDGCGVPPPRYWRKVVAAVQGVVLTVAMADVLPGPLTTVVLVASLALLVESFGRDVAWLWTTRHLRHTVIHDARAPRWRPRGQPGEPQCPERRSGAGLGPDGWAALVGPSHCHRGPTRDRPRLSRPDAAPNKDHGRMPGLSLLTRVRQLPSQGRRAMRDEVSDGTARRHRRRGSAETLHRRPADDRAGRAARAARPHRAVRLRPAQPGGVRADPPGGAAGRGPPARPAVSWQPTGRDARRRGPRPARPVEAARPGVHRLAEPGVRPGARLGAPRRGVRLPQRVVRSTRRHRRRHHPGGGALGLPTLVTLSMRRLRRLVVRHRTGTTRIVAALVVVWVACAAFNVRVVEGVPVADTSATTLANGHGFQVRLRLDDRETFGALIEDDRFGDTPGDQLLTALRGKNVVVAFVESYGRDAVEDPEFAPQVGAVLDRGTSELSAAGFAAQSGFLTSPTFGGGSWLAHDTLLSGLWIDNDQRHRTLLASDRMTLNGAFRRANWQTVGVMPAVTRAWPEGSFFGYDRFYDAKTLAYRGPKFSFGTPARPVHAGQLAAPGAGEARRQRDDRVGAGVEPRALDARPAAARLGRRRRRRGLPGAAGRSDDKRRNTGQIRADYRKSIEYTLDTLISYVQTYGDDDLVFIFLGDHQPAAVVTGENASRDVPISIITRDRAVLDRISGWGWQDGLKPGPQAPVWRMDAFRDRFLTAFGP